MESARGWIRACQSRRLRQTFSASIQRRPPLPTSPTEFNGNEALSEAWHGV